MLVQVFLDSCIIIYLLQRESPLRTAVREVFRQVAAEREVRFFVTDLVRMECRVGPLRDQDAERLQAFDRFFSSRDLTFLSMSRQVFDLAADLRALHKVKTPDALHLASAMHHQCDEFWTNDRRLPGALRERIRIRPVP